MILFCCRELHIGNVQICNKEKKISNFPLYASLHLIHEDYSYRPISRWFSLKSPYHFLWYGHCKTQMSQKCPYHSSDQLKNSLNCYKARTFQNFLSVSMCHCCSFMVSTMDNCPILLIGRRIANAADPKHNMTISSREATGSCQVVPHLSAIRN